MKKKNKYTITYTRAALMRSFGIWSKKKKINVVSIHVNFMYENKSECCKISLQHPSYGIKCFINM